MSQKILLIDGYAMMFRAFYAIRFAPQYKNTNINAVYGCASTLIQSLEEFNPNFLAIAFDAKEATFRHQADTNYKAQREKAPDEFIAQIPYVFQLIENFNIPTLIKPGFEADDIIGTLAKRAEEKNIESVILSGDFDFLQLISPLIHLAKFNGKTPEIYDREKTIKKLGISPEQIVDYKAICGDSSDNYKGIPGIGPKGAKELLEKYKTLENIYLHLDQLPQKIREKLIEYKENAFHCQHLAQIHLNVPVEFEFKNYQYPTDKVTRFFEEVRFPSLGLRAQKLNNNIEQNEKVEQNTSSNKVDSNQQLSLF